MARRAKGSLNGAIADFEKAEQIDPEATSDNRQVADSYSNRGYIEMNDFQLGSAIDDFTIDRLHNVRKLGDNSIGGVRGQRRSCNKRN